MLRDSRRLTGPNLLLRGAGVVLEVECDDAETAIARWRRALEDALSVLGWGEAEVAARSVSGGAILAFSAPIDALYAATEVNEWAWSVAESELEGAPNERPTPLGRNQALASF